MARIHSVGKSRKDQGKCGKCGDALPKGSAYIHWSPGFRGRKRKRCTKPGCRPRPSELTANDRVSRCYAVQEEVEDTISQWDREDVEELRSALETAAETIREVAEEYRESAQAINETAEGSPIAEECEEKADNLESWADTIESAGSDLEEAEQDCETCDGEGAEDCEACDGEGTTTESCEECNGDGLIPCSICEGGNDVPLDEQYDPDAGGDCEKADDGEHQWDGGSCTLCDETREPDGYCNRCRDEDGTEPCGAEGCENGEVEEECQSCIDSEFDGGKVACSNEDCEEGKVKASDEWADECIAAVEEAIGECPL